jgi:hypothetical protein
MDEKRWLTANEMRQAIGQISKSTLRRRIKDLNLIEHGYVLKLGRRLLFSSSLITDLPALVNSKFLPGESQNV